MKCPDCKEDMCCMETVADGKIEIWYCPECGYEMKKVIKSN